MSERFICQIRQENFVLYQNPETLIIFLKLVVPASSRIISYYRPNFLLMAELDVGTLGS